jgi:hypothetical protein
MSLLDDASLLVTPNAEKEGKLYSIIPTNGNGDFSVTRATTATRVNAAGLVELVPYNLLQYSEMFSNAAWLKENSSITANTTTAPNGTLTADKLVENTSNSNHRTFQSYTAPSLGSYTYTCYAKQAGRTMFRIAIFDGGTTKTAFFNIANGTIFSTINCTSSITNVGDGWYRCTITATITSTSLQLQSWLSLPDATTVYTGDGTSGVFIWGAQLVEGTSALDYQATETRLNIPRLDYSLGGCPNILLEPQRTNLFLRSEEFDNASWNKGFSSITSNSTISPSGVQNADTFLADGTNAPHNVAQSISVISGTTYSFSVYAKKNTNNFLQLTPLSTVFGSNVWANFDLNNGVVGSVGSSATASIQSVGNGWYRCSITGAALSTSSVFIAHIIVSSASSLRAEINTLSTSVFLWGAQLEPGAYATSYIPTTSASVTRNADVISRGNIFTNGLITASGGTWFVDLRNNIPLTRDVSNVGMFLNELNSATSGNGFTFRTSSAASTRVTIVKILAGASTTLHTTSANTSKVAIKWNGTTADIFENGVKVISATAFNFTAMQFLSGNANETPKYINSMALFPTPLTDTQCIALTT